MIHLRKGETFGAEKIQNSVVLISVNSIFVNTRKKQFILRVYMTHADGDAWGMIRLSGERVAITSPVGRRKPLVTCLGLSLTRTAGYSKVSPQASIRGRADKTPRRYTLSDYSVLDNRLFSVYTMDSKDRCRRLWSPVSLLHSAQYKSFSKFNFSTVQISNLCYHRNNGH